MNEQYEYIGKTLTPNIARELIQELFAGRTVQKQEMMDIISETHKEQGGLPPKAKRNHPVTLALYNMKRDGQASEEDRSQGIWLIFSRTQNKDSTASDQDDLDSEDLESEKIIGSGKQSVYLYYYPVYQRLAELQDEAIWACKIGKSRNDPIGRIVSQTRTALPEYPKIGLIIKTDELNLMENTIQNILKLQGKQKQDAPGNEWFVTSPSEVERVYESILGNLQ